MEQYDVTVLPLDDIRPGARLVRISGGSLDRAIVGLMALLGRQIAGGADLIVLELGGRYDVHPVTVELLGKLTDRLGALDIGFCLVQRHENMVGVALEQASAEGLLELHETVEDALRFSGPGVVVRGVGGGRNGQTMAATGRSCPMEAREFFQTVAERAGLSREEAADLTRATLSTLAERLSAGETRHLAGLLPSSLNELPAGRAETFGFDEFVRRVSDHTGLTVRETTDGVRAVLTTMHDEIGDEQFEHVTAQLPREFQPAS